MCGSSTSSSPGSYQYLFFLFIPSLLFSGITYAPLPQFHFLYSILPSTIEKIISNIRISPMMNKSRQQYCWTQSAPETYKLNKKQNITYPLAYKTRLSVGFWNSYCSKTKAAFAMMRSTIKQKQVVMLNFNTSTANKANKPAFTQLANYNHFVIGFSVSESNILYRTSCAMGKMQRTAKMTIGGTMFVVVIISQQRAWSIKGKQNHLNKPLNSLQTLVNVMPASLTLAGIVMRAMSMRNPTRMTMKDRANGLAQTNVPDMLQQKLAIALSDSAIKLLPTSKLVENGIATEQLLITTARKYPHWIQSKARE